MSSISSSSNSKEGLPRKLTAIATTGNLGQLFTVYERNWMCPDCNQENYASRPKCFRCKKSKPEGLNNYVMDPALQAIKEGHEITWKEAVDPTTYQVYYYNTATGETQWDRPAELGPAPVATGWFGRGASGSSTQRYKDLNQKYLSRPARKQKEFVDPKKYINEVGSDYNIWYGKHVGDMDNTVNKEPATDRCVLEKDAGYTRADAIAVSASGESAKRVDRRFFCLHFAHGICAKGSDCIYYHRIPTQEDDANCDELRDCFGRRKHSKHRDDMNGVGSFTKPNRTLYVGNLLKHKYDSPKALEDALWRHFSEWGELENLNVIHKQSIAFPRYRFRTSAEFAKEAMGNQKLDHDEILMVRWAYDDPNPIAQDAINRADKDAMAALLLAKGVSLSPTGLSSAYTSMQPMAGDAKMTEYLSENPDMAYPNTSQQYGAENAYASQTQWTKEQIDAYYASYYASYGYTAPQTSIESVSDGPSLKRQRSAESDEGGLAALKAAYLNELDQGDDDKDNNNKGEDSEDTHGDHGREENSNEQESEEDDEEEEDSDDGGSGWKEFLDPDTGATYYYNKSSGVSSWEKPADFDEKE